MIKNLNFSGLLFLVVVLAIFVFSSCRKDKLGDVEKVHQETEIQTNSDLEFFLSREKTYNLLKPSTVNWEKVTNQVSDRNDEISELQNIITDINTHLSEKYVSQLIDKVGYPLWDASTLEFLENGGYTLFTPVFKGGSDKINGLFSYTNTADGSVAYNISTRKQLEDSAITLKDPNFLVKVSLYKYYDQLLFNHQPVIYEYWKDLEMDILSDCEQIFKFTENSILPNFNIFTCTDVCSNNLFISNILDTPGEINWLKGNCNYADVIDEFLAENNYEHKNEMAQVFYNISMTNVLTLSEMLEITTAFEAFIENPDDDSVFSDITAETIQLMLEVENWLGVDGEPITGAEAALVAQHPRCALKIFENSLDAKDRTAARFPGMIAYLNCGDAFRHSHFLALNTVSCGAAIAEAFGIAHESNDPPSSGDVMMDLHNNLQGIATAVANPGASSMVFETETCTKLNAGIMYVLSDTSDPLSTAIPSTGCTCAP